MALNFGLTSDGCWRTKNAQKSFSEYLKSRICKIKSELYTDDNKSKNSSNPKDIFKSAKSFYETLYTKETTSKATTIEFLSKIHNRK